MPFAKRAGIRDLLVELVESLPEGALLPSERELATRWRVARMTLRRAMDELIAEDLVVRKQGSARSPAGRRSRGNC